MGNGETKRLQMLMEDLLESPAAITVTIAHRKPLPSFFLFLLAFYTFTLHGT